MTLLACGLSGDVRFDQLADDSPLRLALLGGEGCERVADGSRNPTVDVDSASLVLGGVPSAALGSAHVGYLSARSANTLRCSGVQNPQQASAESA